MTVVPVVVFNPDGGAHEKFVAPAAVRLMHPVGQTAADVGVTVGVLVGAGVGVTVGVLVGTGVAVTVGVGVGVGHDKQALPTLTTLEP